MSRARPLSSEPLTPEAGKKLDVICNRFEAACCGSVLPRIEDFLSTIPDGLSRTILLRELIHLDVHYRRTKGEIPRFDDYEKRFPDIETTWLKELLPPQAVNNYETKVNDSNSSSSEPPDDPVPIQSLARYKLSKTLGQGAFGVVYLAQDEQLHRRVAIKVPHRKFVVRPDAAEAYLTEARTVANLDHPNIVPVYDVGSTDECPCFIVSKFIEGGALAERIESGRPSFRHAAELVATVAEALHYAHRLGLVHRDIKPGNILVDTGGKPFVVDFGLALKEEDIGKGPNYAGTPAYMSPEQARGEGHRVDGRSDIFSLGVVLYELLTGRRPFHADSCDDLLEQIITHDARPPRQWDETIPKELERICLRSLSKRASDRYTAAKDMADDLRHFLAQQPSDGEKRHELPGSQPVVPPPSPVAASGPAVQPKTPSSDSHPIRIVPKGLRSFDAHDADFFLELVPGPRDREGLPDSIRFWKTRIEERDTDKTFAVGLICGPSGCGKSSLVKAGLLPRLSQDVIAVYLEATAEETENRLLNGLRKRLSTSDNLTLKETIAALRRGQGLPVVKKVVVILDQFEQWLHANKEEQSTELVQALRQCDGSRVQCIVMVRDDFWMAVIRFMRELDTRLVDGQNSAAVDLFDMDHARKVLAAFGRAFGKLPETSGETSTDQKEFLTQAVFGLAQEGKVIPVRLALFAEMMKGKAWTPATLKEVGGAEGVGVTFLEETFSAANAPPEHRYHQKAARAVLRALLPESGTDLKGHMRARAELLEASGYAAHPKDFDELLRILDAEVHLLTPTDLEGKDDGERMPSSVCADSSVSPPRSSVLFYQLTHDYLVPALRDWLTRKQKETRRGRAELLLADRAAVWNARPENRQLPSLWQWLNIRWLTHKRDWTPSQKKMMRKAGRHLFLDVPMRVAIFSTFSALVLFLLVIFLPHRKDLGGPSPALALRDRLLDSPTAAVPNILREIRRSNRPLIDPLLHAAYSQAEETNDSRKQLHASLALLHVDPKQVEYLYGRLLKADSHEIVVIREALLDDKGDPLFQEDPLLPQYLAMGVAPRLWALLEDPKNDQEQRFRAACALAGFSRFIYDKRWEKVGGDIAVTLVNQDSYMIAQWTEVLKGAGRWLIQPLTDFLVDEDRSVSAKGFIAKVYGNYAADTPDAYVRLEKELAKPNEPNPTVEAKIALAKRHASIGLALLDMGKGEKFWPLMKHTSDPTLRSYLMDRLAESGVAAKVLTARLDVEQDVSVKRAIMLSLGEFGLDRMPVAERRNLSPRLLQLYRDDPDPGIHGAAEWLLRKWGEAARLAAAQESLRKVSIAGGRRWYVDGAGQTMVVIRKPGEVWMGDGPEKHRRTIDWSFVIASKEVTVDEFSRFRHFPDDFGRKLFGEFFPTGDCPMHNVTWYEAAEYCNWLSKKEKIPETEWCYLPNAGGKYDESTVMAPNYLKRTGYRLPMEEEWEYACRASSDTRFSFGESVDLLVKYAWISANSLSKSSPVGLLKPNDLGMFDMHGNAQEWCQDIFAPYRIGGDGKEATTDENASEIFKDKHRVLRGGSWFHPAMFARSANRLSNPPANRNNHILGFRLARTLPHGSFTALSPTPEGSRK